MLADALTVPGLLVRHAERALDRRAVVTADESITYAELDAGSRAYAGRLVAAGVNSGDRVGLLAPNGIAWVVHAAAVMRIGATLVPLSTLLRPPELLAQLHTATVTHLVAVDEFRSRRHIDDLDAVAPGLTSALEQGRRHAALPSLRAVWRLDALPDATAPADVVQAMEDHVRPSDDLAILFTSGSRGTPKGVIHTHGGAIRATAAGLDVRCIGPDERLYIPMPFFWMGGFGGGLLSTLVAGATLLTEAIPDPATTLSLLDRERATLFRGWPDQAARLAEHPDFASADLSSLGGGSLAAVLPPERRPEPESRANLFGMTESFGPYCGARLDRDLPREKFGSCGRPFDSVEVRIIDPERGSEVPPGTTGEIQLRGPDMMRGICGRSDRDVFTIDGFYPTGDVGRLDDDGYLWFEGRRDDMVKLRGVSVFPTEVEAALRRLDDVNQAHVSGLEGVGGPEIGAVVVTGTELASVRDRLRETLSGFKVPTRWLLTDDPGIVPLLPSGKVDIAGLRHLLNDRGVSS